MLHLKFADVFTLLTGLATFLYSIYLIGKMTVSASISQIEIQSLSVLVLINAVNLIHRSTK